MVACLWIVVLLFLIVGGDLIVGLVFWFAIELTYNKSCFIMFDKIISQKGFCVCELTIK